MSDMAILDSSELAGLLSTGGVGVEVLVCSTPATGVSSPACFWFGMMGSK